jgi:hypothetical protein
LFPQGENFHVPGVVDTLKPAVPPGPPVSALTGDDVDPAA